MKKSAGHQWQCKNAPGHLAVMADALVILWLFLKHSQIHIQLFVDIACE